MNAAGPIVEFKDGGFVLDATFLADRFAIGEAQMRDLMAKRMVQSVVERGEGEDAGRWRLSVRIGNRVWRGIVFEGGHLQSETMGLAPVLRPSSKRHP